MPEPRKPSDSPADRATTRDLARLSKWKAGGVITGRQPQAMGGELVRMFKQDIEPLHKKVGKVAEIWVALVPQMFLERSALVSFTQGTLMVSIESSPHLYELQLLLRSGLQKQILLAGAKHGLRKISLRRGAPV